MQLLKGWIYYSIYALIAVIVALAFPAISVLLKIAERRFQLLGYFQRRSLHASDIYAHSLKESRTTATGLHHQNKGSSFAVLAFPGAITLWLAVGVGDMGISLAVNALRIDGRR